MKKIPKTVTKRERKKPRRDLVGKKERKNTFTSPCGEREGREKGMSGLKPVHSPHNNNKKILLDFLRRAKDRQSLSSLLRVYIMVRAPLPPELGYTTHIEAQVNDGWGFFRFDLSRMPYALCVLVVFFVDRNGD